MTFMETITTIGGFVGTGIFFAVVIAGIILFLRLIMEP